jgi:hypothetical protein
MKRTELFLIPIIMMMFVGVSLSAENIDPMNDGSQYAYGENVGWFNFEPIYGPGVTVENYKITGYLWAENIGWINLSPSIYGGVLNDGNGNLLGYAWGENVGWINFDPTYGGVRVDARGYIEGWAWGENIGWIHLQYNIDLTITWTGINEYTLMWNTTQNFIYHVFISSDLVSWIQQGGDVTGDDGATKWIDLYSGTKKFYKVTQVNPPGYRVRTSW